MYHNLNVENKNTNNMGMKCIDKTQSGGRELEQKKKTEWKSIFWVTKNLRNSLKCLNWSQNGSAEVKVFAVLAVNPGLIHSTKYDPPNTIRMIHKHRAKSKPGAQT